MTMLIIIMGLPGSGKTYFARAFAKSIGGKHINSDIIRKHQDKQPEYTLTDKAAVYKTMFETVCQLLKRDKIVIVDATFSLQQYRDPYFNFVNKNQIPVNLILIEANAQTIAHRLQKKRPDSDADFAVYKKIRSEFEPLNIEHLVLSSDQLSLEEMVEQGLEFTGIKKRTDD